MNTPATTIDAAESAVTEELDAIVADLRSLAERAKAAKENAKRLTNLKARGEAVEKEIREASGRIDHGGEKEARPPEVVNGEYLDSDQLQRVREAREKTA